MLNGQHMPQPHELVEVHAGQILPVMFFYALEDASYTDIANALGYEITYIDYGSDHAKAEDAEEWLAAHDADPDKVLSEWQPVAPEGFVFGGKWHTEDGIQACFLRQAVR